MKLLHKESNTFVSTLDNNNEYKIVNGIKANIKGENTVAVNEIIHPTSIVPDGILIVNLNPHGDIVSWQRLKPFVLGMKWVEDDYIIKEKDKKVK